MESDDLEVILGVTPPANVVRKVTFGPTGSVQRYVYVGTLYYTELGYSYMSFFIDGFSNYGAIIRNRGFVTFGARYTITMNKVLLETAEGMNFGYVRNGDIIDFYMSTQGNFIGYSTVVELSNFHGEFYMQEIGAFPDNITLFQQ